MQLIFKFFFQYIAQRNIFCYNAVRKEDEEMTTEERISMGDRIKIARELRNMTLEDIAKEIGVAKSTIQRYETGKINTPKIPVVMAIADALNVDPSWLTGKTDTMDPQKTAVAPGPPKFSNIRPITIKKFPLMDGIAAGKPRLMPDGISLYVDATVDIQADYVLKVHGDSMVNARIHDGDIVFIREQPEVENGEIAAVAIGDEATLKRVYWYQNRSLLILRAENPAYKDMEFSGQELEDVRIMGKAVAFQSDLQ
jgi:repressor LexA